MKSLPEGVGIAHDVKNCLQMILAASGLLENGAQDMERRKKYFAVTKPRIESPRNSSLSLHSVVPFFSLAYDECVSAVSSKEISLNL